MKIQFGDLRPFLPWVAAVGMIIVVFGTIYSTVQQAQRSAANMPQIQLAEDTANVVNGEGAAFASLYPSVDIAKSLAPFTIIYDKDGKPVSGSGTLNGKLPTIDKGVLTAAKGKDYNAVTWEPQSDVRIAAVTVASKNGYVLSGRSLEEVEKNENKSLELALVGGIGTLLLLAAWFVLKDIIKETV